MTPIIESVLKYRSRGWRVTPVAGKIPVLDDWPNVDLDEEGIRRSFSAQHNVGVVLAPSGLADLDFDDPVAVRALQALRPPDLEGAAMFKHGDRPHILVRAAGVETRRFKRADGSTLLELRCEGAQTVFPPSVHEDGLTYEWVRDAEPCRVDTARLHELAATIATVAYSSEFWNRGARHDLSLALAGFLGRRLPEDDVVEAVSAVATVAADAEFRDREEAVRTTVKRLRAGQTATGLPTIERLAPELAKAIRSWWPDDGSHRGPEDGASNLSQANALVEIGREAELFHDTSGSAFARLSFDDRAEIWPTTSKRFKGWLRREHFHRHGKAPSSDAVNSACGVLDGIACFDGQEHDLHNRVAEHDGAFYYDLADSRWRAVCVDLSGWRIVARPPILFRRHSHQAVQVEPLRDGNARDILRFLNVQPDTEVLLLVWLIASFVPGIPHPVPDFHGEKGSGKTLGQRALRRLVDPSVVESLSFPTDVRELVQQLSHHYAPLYDNVDALPAWISDILCRAVTGEGFSKRELYSDDEDVIYSYRRVVMLNGVNVVPQRPDLLDRSILIALDRIPRTQRREERAFWAEFERARPAILGGIFDALSRAMTIHPKLDLPELERMADFTRWGAAISESLGYGADAFLSAYGANLRFQTREAVQGHTVGAAVLALMGERGEWSGTPTELLTALEEAGESASLFKRAANGKVQARGWPGAPHILSRRLNEVRSNLADLGIEIGAERTNDRTVTIRTAAPDSDESSVGSDSSGDQVQLGLDSPDATADATQTAASGSDGKHSPSQIRDDATDATDAALRLPGGDTQPARACHNCGRQAWWQRPDGEWVCGVCHPDPREPVAARVLYDGDRRGA